MSLNVGKVMVLHYCLIPTQGASHNKWYINQNIKCQRPSISTWLAIRLPGVVYEEWVVMMNSLLSCPDMSDE